MDVATRAWPDEARHLWQRIQAHAFENPEINLDFARRLARTLGWPLETARAGIEEYRRFCFLACVATRAPVTPSEEVDEIWHLHLTYTRDYWEGWCGQALGRKLHHDPTAGGPAEGVRYRTQYADTLALYERWFGPPPIAFWPGTHARFATRPRWRMVDSQTAFVLPRLGLRWLRGAGLAGLAMLAPTPAAAAISWNPFDLPGEAFLLLYICLLPMAALLTAMLRDLVRTTRRPADLRELSPVEIGYITGGMDRAADTAILALAAAGVAQYTDKSVTVLGSNGALPPEMERYRAALQGTRPRKAMIGMFRESLLGHDLLADLRRRNVLLEPDRAQWLSTANGLPVGVIFAFGLIKIFVGLSRDKPVLFLVGLCVLTMIGLLVAIFRERPFTREGEEAFEACKAQAARAIRAPRPAEVALAFAFGGVAALAGTEHVAYGKVISPPSSGGSGCGTSTSTSGGDGGGGGSGCGGGGCGGCSS